MRFRSLELNIEQLTKEANNGNHGAQAELSLEYLIGEKVDRDIPKAVNYMEMAAEDIYAINMCFKSARETEEPAAFFAIALQWEYGFGVPHSFEQCAKNLMIAAEKNYPYAQQMLGEKYRFGFGLDEDVIKCEYWHLKALEAGITEAHFNLYLLYSQEEQVIDLNKAWFHLQKAIAHDSHPNSYVSMGEAYFEGKLISTDKIEAAKWFLIAQKKYDYKPIQLKELEKLLSHTELDKAELMAKEWLVAHVSK